MATDTAPFWPRFTLYPALSVPLSTCSAPTFLPFSYPDWPVPACILDLQVNETSFSVLVVVTGPCWWHVAFGNSCKRIYVSGTSIPVAPIPNRIGSQDFLDEIMFNNFILLSCWILGRNLLWLSWWMNYVGGKGRQVWSCWFSPGPFWAAFHIINHGILLGIQVSKVCWPSKNVCSNLH